MAYAVAADKTALIEELQQLIRARWAGEEAELVDQFVGAYYRSAAPTDLAERPLDDLYGAAVSHWRLLRQGREPLPRIHVYNPNTEQHGWESTHTVVQVVSPDMPFLVDSVSMALNRLGLTIHLIVHPVIRLCPDAEAATLRVGAPDEAACRPYACMHFEVDRQTEAEVLGQIESELRDVLADVARAVADWQPMREQLQAALEELRQQPPPLPAEDLAETVAFLEWLVADHFTFLGYRRYDLKQQAGEIQLERIPDSGLGILHTSSRRKVSTGFAALPQEVRLQAQQPSVLLLTKSSTRSTVHRPGHMDYVGIKRFNADGEVIGEHRFIGLYTSAAYNRTPREIPLLRRKIDHVLEKAQLPRSSHAGKALLNILETHPRDELIQADPEQLHEIAVGILHLQERQRVRLFVRYDDFRRFVSCLVYAPRERYNTEVRERMQTILQRAFGGEQSEFNIKLSESVLARIHFIVRLPEPGQPQYDHAALEAQLAQTLRSWNDDYHQALLEHLGEEQGNRLFARYREAFTAAYREDTSPRTAAHDTDRLEQLGEDELAISLYRPLEAAPGVLRFKLYHCGRAVTLSDVLPMLENMGVQVVDERPYDIQATAAPVRWIHDFGLRYGGNGELDAEQVREIFQEAFAAVWYRRSEDDGYNRLVLAAGLTWREIAVLRAYGKYLRQAGTTFSQSYIEETLASYPQITRLLVQLFHARFDPRQGGNQRAEKLVEAIEAALNEVPGLDEDRILRRYLAAVQATLRSNYFRTDADGRPRDYLAFKLSPAEIPEVPRPHPLFEIFVYAPRFEGVHLRGGRVARGGLRWSDRREDFRTEVLGLVKAQMVKNSVIVPVGAKGGFVVKQAPAEREELQAEVRACYTDFIRGLLDLTDNQTEEGVAPPPQLVRHDDDDDPYLVVAADKGTATFSDLANEVAAEYDFWLRDAFASGGSSGYDHKKMGITARGAWEAVKRHFRELGLDIQQKPFSVVGIGDMSGDVFGNGMLLSRQIRLLAAFDHRHIFIDPDPDPAAAYAERERLFKLPRSAWADYDSDKLSKGGGVYPRSAKSIRLSAEARRALGIEQEQLSPTALIRAILCAPVDLVWNGGIGTYIKASTESHAEVGDKANDAVRVDADRLRCRVVGEGGNLGVTQRGRIEYASGGGHINTDAIDNAGGVDCSDHEVNIKILLNGVVADGDLTLKQRNRLLSDMTEEVAQLVLRNNYRQSQALTLCQLRGADLLDEQARFMRQLEKEGRLERALEYLPDDEALAERAASRRGLTRPELAVLLSYAKIHSYSQLLDDPLVDEAFLQGELQRYFPQPLQQRYPERIADHRLRREITATEVTNGILDRLGSTFFFRMQEKLGTDVGTCTRAYLTAREVFGLEELWTQVEALDNHIGSEVQMQLLLDLAELHERAAYWLLRNHPGPQPVDAATDSLRPLLERLRRILPEVLPKAEREALEQQAEQLTAAGVPAALAQQVAGLEALYPALDIAKVASDCGASLERAAALYFAVTEQLELNWLRGCLVEFAPADRWQERARAGLEEEFHAQLRQVTADILCGGGKAPEAGDQVLEWAEQSRAMHDRFLQTLAELKATAQLDLPMLVVALHEFTALVEASAARPLVARKRQPQGQTSS